MKKNIENHISILVESRAIAAIEYEDIINEIVDDLYNQTKNYISNINIDNYPIVYLGNNIPVKVIQFNINANQNIINKITELKDLPIQINGLAYFLNEKDINKVKIDNTNAFYRSSIFDNVENKQLKSHKHVIVLNMVSYNGRVSRNWIYTQLLHELNHVFENYYRLSNTNNNFGVAKSQKIKYKKSNFNDFIGMEKESRYCKFIVYFLFNDSELSAHATEVYSYLKSINGKRDNYSIDIKNCESYKEYKSLYNMISQLNNVNNKEFWEYIKNKTQYKDLSSGEFKNKFIKKSWILLEKYLRKIGAVASLYYDKNNGNTDIIDIY